MKYTESLRLLSLDSSDLVFFNKDIFSSAIVKMFFFVATSTDKRKKCILIPITKFQDSLKTIDSLNVYYWPLVSEKIIENPI